MKLPLLTALLLASALSLSAAISDLDKKFNIKRAKPAATTAPKKTAARSTPKSVAKPAKQRNEVRKESPTTPKEPTHIVLDTGYNGAQVKLPIWYWERTQELHEKLKEKLSPADYSEILQGEYYLFNGGRYYFYTGKGSEPAYITKDPLPVIKKLEAILADPSDEVFPRCRFVESEHEGVFFRENARRCGQSVAWADERCIVTRTSGLTGGYSTLQSFWDSRTLEKISAITTPVYTKVRKKKDNTYLLISEPSEMFGERWFHEIYQGCDIFIVDPFTYLFQILYEVYGQTEYLEKYKNLDKDIRKGNLYEKVKDDIVATRENDESQDYQREGNANGALTEAQLSCSGYIRGHTHASNEITFYQTEKVGLNIDFSRLSTRYDEEIALKSRRQPAPKELCNDEMEAYVSDWNSGWVAFHAYHLFPDVSDEPEYAAVTGILNQEGEVYLFPAEEKGPFPIESFGNLYKYDGKRDKGKLEYDWAKPCDAPFRRGYGSYMDLLQVAPISPNEMEIIMGGEMIPSRDEVQRIRLNTSTMQYQTIAKWEFPHQSLVPVWLPSQEWLFKPESDNGYSIIHAPAGGAEEKIADLYLFEDNGFALVLPNGHFAGSPGCEKALGYASGGKEIGMDALSPWRNRPAEVLGALGGKEDDIAALRETTRRWLSKQGYDMEKMPQEPDINAFPEVEVNLPDLHQEKKTLDVDVVVRAKNAAVKQLLVRADGQLVPLEKDISVAANGEEKVTVSVPLAVGQNWIEITAVDEQGLVGATQRFRVIHKSALTSDLYVICLGVSEYENPDLKLQYAAKDAKDVAAAFQKQPGKVRTLTLTDSEFRDASALEKIRGFLSATTIDDRVIMYCAGHGMLDDRLNYYFAPAAFDPEDIAGTGIAMDQLTDCMAKAPARKKLLLLDTCHAGILGEEDEEKLALAGISLPHGVRAIVQRGMKAKQVQTGLNAKQTKRFIEELFSHNDSTRGMNIITASAGSEFALESDQWQNGIFAASIIRALTSEFALADNNCNGRLDCGELRDYVTWMVSSLSAGKQRAVVNCSEDAAGFEITTTERKEGNADDLERYAYTLQRLRLLMRIIRKGGDVNSKVEGQTALHLAATVGKVDIIKELIERGADVNGFDGSSENTRYTPFHVACLMGCTEAIDIMLDHGADINMKTESDRETESGQSPLQLITSEKSAKRIVEMGASIREASNIYWACKNGSLDYIRFLLEHGANPNEGRALGKPPLRAASERKDGRSEEVAILLKKNGAIDDRAYLEPFIRKYERMDQSYDRHLNYQLREIRWGADVNEAHWGDEPSLLLACYFGDVELVRHLVNLGANPTQLVTQFEGMNNITPLDMANWYNTPYRSVNSPQAEQIRAILQRGPSASNHQASPAGGRADLKPLIDRMRALKCKHADSALYQKRLLVLLPMIYNGSDVNITLPDTKGNTALHYSCAIGSLSITKWLLEHGANPNAVTYKGATPLQCVGSDNGTAIRNLLIQHGATR